MLAPCLLALALIPAADPKPRLDADGIPLPAEAVRRFGSQRFLCEYPAFVAVRADGKTVFAARFHPYLLGTPPAAGSTVEAWDTATGVRKWRYADAAFRRPAVALDTDGITIWLADNTYGAKPVFVRVKLSAANGKELERKQLHDERVEAFDVHPSGLVAWARYDSRTSDLSLPVTGPDGREQARWEPDGQFIDRVKFAPDGKTVFAGGRTFVGDGYKLTAADAATGKARWSVPCGPVDALAVSADGKVVAACVPGEVKPAEVAPGLTASVKGSAVVALDAATGRQVGRCELAGASHTSFRSGFPYTGRPMTFDPDGKTLRVLTGPSATTPIGTTTWAAGEPQSNATAFSWFAPDRKSYFAPGGRNLVALDATTHQPMPHSPPPLRKRDGTAADLAFTPDADRLIWAAAFGDRVEWEVKTGKEAAHQVWPESGAEGVPGFPTTIWNGPQYAIRSPDGKWVLRAAAPPADNRPTDFEVTADGRRVGRVIPLRVGAAVGFSPDSRYVFEANGVNGLRVWEVGKDADPRFVAVQRAANETEDRGGGQHARHPTANRVAVFEPTAGIRNESQRTWRIAQIDLADAKRVAAGAGPGRVVNVGYARTGRLAGVCRALVGRQERFNLFVLDPEATTARLHPIDHSVACGAVSPDGRALAVGAADGVRLYELATGQRRHTFAGLTRPVEAVAFSPDGRFLASESADGPVLLWDVRGDLTKPAKPDAGGWDSAWNALGGDDAAKAFQAIRLFALYPDGGVEELKRRFAEQKGPSEAAVAALVAKLGDADFQTRERATKELRELGFAAFPALKKALADSPPEELRARAERLLAATTSPDQRRAERAVEALQLANTEAAKKLLAEWAKGAADDVLTKAAKRAGR